MTKPTRRAGLYRIFAAERLLYIGIGYNPQARWAAHAKEKDWWPLVTHKTVEWYDSWASAKAAETFAIKTERPIYNVVGAPNLVLEGSTWIKYVPNVPRDVSAEASAARHAANAKDVARVRLRRAAAAFTEGAERHETDRQELAEAIAEAFRAGARPSEVDEIAPYDRNHIGRIRKAAGLPPARPATVVSKRKAEATGGPPSPPEPNP